MKSCVNVLWCPYIMFVIFVNEQILCELCAALGVKGFPFCIIDRCFEIASNLTQYVKLIECVLLTF